MVLMAAEGLRNDQIAARLRCGRDVVSKWRKRFFEQRLAGLEDRPRPGRPRLFPPQVRAEVIRLACELPAEKGVPLARWSSAELAAGGGQARDRRDRSRRSRSGAGCARTRSVRGTTTRGSSPATRSSPRRPAGSLTSTRVAGRDSCSSPAISWCAPMRSRRSKPARASIPACPPHRRRRAVGRARVRQTRRAVLPRRLGHQARQAVRSLRAEGWDRAVRSARRSVHEHPALQQGQARVRGRRDDRIKLHLRWL